MQMNKKLCKRGTATAAQRSVENPSYIFKCHVSQSFRAILRDFLVRGRLVGTECAYIPTKSKAMRNRRPHAMASFVAHNLCAVRWMEDWAPSRCVRETLIR